METNNPNEKKYTRDQVLELMLKAGEFAKKNARSYTILCRQDKYFKIVETENDPEKDIMKKKKKTPYPPQEECIWENDQGYLIARLINKGGGFDDCPVHYLMAQTFLENPNNHEYVLHRDGDIKNNHIDNLFWSKTQ